MNVGLKVSKGGNVFSAETHELSFNSKYKHLKFLADPIDDETVVPLTGLDIPDEWEIPHGLGFNPAFLSFAVDLAGTFYGPKIYRIPLAYAGDYEMRLYMGASDNENFSAVARAANPGSQAIRTITFYSEAERLT